MSEMYDIKHTNTDMLVMGDERFGNGLSVHLGEDMRLHFQVNEKIGPGKIDMERKDASGKLLESAHMEISNPVGPRYQASLILVDRDGKGAVIEREEALISRHASGYAVEAKIQDPSGRLVATSSFRQPSLDAGNSLGSESASSTTELKDAKGRPLETIELYDQPLGRGFSFNLEKRDSNENIVRKIEQHTGTWPSGEFTQNTVMKDASGKEIQSVHIEENSDGNDAEIRDAAGNIVETLHVSKLSRHDHGYSSDITVKDAKGNVIETMVFDTVTVADGATTSYVKRNAQGAALESGSVRVKNNAAD